MLHSVHFIEEALTLGWLYLFIVAAIFALFDRRRLRAWMLPPLLALPLGFAWYRLWWDYGWVGTPRMIHSLLHTDGEGAYDATFVEMVLILGAALAVALWLLTRERKYA